MVRIFILIFSSLLFIRCANIVPPTGGPRDTQEPKVLSEYPKNGTTNYKENYITLTFDEPIVENQLTSKVLVSPTIEGNFTSKIKKNTVKLSWTDTLKPNTTYTFNLADGIKDNTEGNKIKNYSVTFSTGDHIDTNKIHAEIKTVPGSTNHSNIKLLLFPKTDTLLRLLKSKPEYVGTANDSGEVEISYVKHNIYETIAIYDLNSNNKWDKDEPVDIQELSIKDHLHRTFQLQKTVLDTTRIISANSKDKYINILLSKGLQEIKIKDENGFYLPTKISSRKYQLENQYNLKDSTKIQIEYVDSLGIRGAYSKIIKFKNIDIQKDKDTIINITNIHKKYVLKPKLDSIQFSTDRLIDTIQLKLTAPEHVSYVIKNYSNSFTVIFKGQKENDSLKFTIPYKSIHSIYSEYNKEYTQVLTTGEEKMYGNLQYEIKTIEKTYTSHLENSTGTIIYTSKNQSINKIKNIDPGSYKLYVFIDTNKDGYWNAYDPIHKIPAEPIIYFKENLTIRANWDLEDIQMIF
ncbi:Ig-like domain-containing protein [Cytophaga aurantiaca]|uniref:Ig-like domain-containing protein n=1 Tax=Cytophaga aurantiaca TaxID=29530 RepID=UPI0003770CFE|nr:Ig-like domain-containing protein [Cytophaga aurantiaca]